MYSTIMKHYEDGKSLAVNTCKNCLWGKSFEEEIRFSIMDESNEKMVTDILKLQDILLSYCLGFWQGIAVYTATVGWQRNKWTTCI